MTFRKNVFSYLLWAMFTASVCIYHIAVMMLLLDQTPLRDEYGQMGVIGLTIVLAGGIFALLHRLAKNRGAEADKHRVVHLIWESTLVVLLLGTGIFVRAYMAGSGTQEAAFFETASVTGEPVIPIAHGAQYLYVLLLRGLFILVGNHFTAGIILQIFLQALAALIWYFGIRRISGPVASLLYMAGIMLLPASIQEGLTYSPKMLYLLLCGIVFLMSGRALRRQKKGTPLKWYAWLQTVLLGVGIGVLTYLDVSGLLLLLPVFFLYGVKEDEGALTGARRFVQVSLQILTVVLAFFLTALLLLFLDGAQNGAGIAQVFDIWCTLFSYKGMSGLPALLYPADPAGIYSMPIVSFLLLFGIPAFFVHEKRENQMMYFFFLLGAVVIIAGGFHASGMTVSYLAFSLVLALMGVGVQGAMQKSIADQEQRSLEENLMEKAKSEPEKASGETETQKVEQERKSEEKKAEEKKSEDKKAVDKKAVDKKAQKAAQKEQKAAQKARLEAEKAAKKLEKGADKKKPEQGKGAVAAAVAGKPAAPAKKPGMIENPLPLPKQHETKVLDYPYFVATDKLRYDIKVSPDDDFDI